MPRRVARKAADFGVSPPPLSWVDWDKSSAYSLAIGKIYLNLRDREADGIVDPAQLDELLTRITERLYELKDPDSGEKVVRASKSCHESSILKSGWGVNDCDHDN